MKENKNSYRNIILLTTPSILNLLFLHYYFVFKGFYYSRMYLFTPVLNLLSVLLDVSCILFLLMLLTRKRLKLSLLLCFLITLLWSFANCLYGRFFFAPISLSSIQQGCNLFDGVVIHSMLSGLEIIDMYFCCIIITYAAICKYIKSTLFHVEWKKVFNIILIPFFSLSLSIVVYSFYHFTSPHSKNHPERFYSQLNEFIINPFIWKNGAPVNVHFLSGSIRFIISDIIDEYRSYKLSEHDIEIIKNEYLDYSKRKSKHKTNKELKNVIFILLESFLSSSSDLTINGKEITPFLNKLKHDSTVYYNGHIKQNITIGESGDGQLIYMTGLLPLRNKITVGIAKNRVLPGLPLILKRKFAITYSEIIIPSSPVVWEQRYMNKRYGIDNMLSAADIGDLSAFYTTEEKVFNLAKTTGKENKQPFFSMVLGISTHNPYDEPVTKEFNINNKRYPRQYTNYLIACNYVDKQIEEYLRYLKEKSIYNNSLIIIASDHCPHIDQLKMQNKVVPDMPLYIINSGIPTSSMYKGSANQLDVYTTILDVLGINNTWLGLGHSLLLKEYESSVNDKAYELSNKILMGNFFKDSPSYK